jgi:Tfp pilus assembly protein PilN
MAVKLNLLPQGTSATGTLGKVLKTTKMFGVILIAFFLIFALGISAFFIVSSITLKNLNSDLDSLKSQISALESTEQQAVLLKDRLAKIKTALAIPSAIKNLEGVNPYVSNLPPAASLTELNVDAQKVDFSIQFGSTSDLSAFLRSLSETKNFPVGVLTEYSFNPASGYLVSVRLSNK